MKTASKTNLFLLELILMVLIFSLSAAVCIRVFAYSESLSSYSSDLSNATIKAQSAASFYKHSGDLEYTAAQLFGTIKDETVITYYAKDWRACADAETASYVLTIKEDSAKALIDIQKINESDNIFSLSVKAVQHE